MNLTLGQKKDLFRLIGEELSRQYRLKNLSFSIEYDTSVITHDTNISDAIKQYFINPFLDQFHKNNETINQLQTVLSSVHGTTTDFYRVLRDSEDQVNKSYSLTVEKALLGDTGVDF